MSGIDLSCNNLVVWHTTTFLVSGKTPQRIAQFGTFDESSYRGNRLLCGEPLRRCFEPPSPFTPKVPTDDGEDNGPIDTNFFYVSFGASYIVVLLAIASVLYINPYRHGSIM
ncbi:hypothetical protein COLO4_33361 [Corchorus olitorius]|uniref:Uncharacterized protein n=1 Tax=Corchorus olitorius TaxID=93759 RepID=A0A1R3GUA1_9ROSI|nr:hypothetical protein COLO4_33361 [Corchorus olitorius]